MNTAFLLTLLLGILWSLVGAVVAMARRSGCPIWSFYTCGSLLSTLLLIACGFCSPGELKNCGCSMIVFLALGALLNALGQALSMYNLRGGARALIFAIPQMNFVVVFLFSVLFLQERTSPAAVTGIVLLCAAILGINFFGANFKSQWRADLKNDFRAVGKSRLKLLPSAVTAETALLPNAGKHFKAAGRTFEIGSLDRNAPIRPCRTGGSSCSALPQP